MRIGIDASRAFQGERTGIEEYSYQIIQHLTRVVPSTDEVILYTRTNGGRVPTIDFELPKHWHVKPLTAPRFWTQLRLSFEMLLHPVDVLFIPAHIVPWIHPAQTMVVIHGLEYEFSPESYSLYERWYMRMSIRFSCWAAARIIAVSQNTKQDLVKLYEVKPEKVDVIHEGFTRPRDIPSFRPLADPYFFFVGRIETRKNILRIIQAFEYLKSEMHLPHKLVLAGKFGYGGSELQEAIAGSPVKDEIILPGYVTNAEKWQWLRFSDVFLFPSLYEGFGLPILEAQAQGSPVVTSHTSSLPEVAGTGAVYVDPLSVESLKKGIYKLVTEPQVRAGIIEQGRLNCKRFSWGEAALSLYGNFLKRNQSEVQSGHRP